VPKQTVPQETEYDFGFTPFIENGKMAVVEIWEGSAAEGEQDSNVSPESLTNAAFSNSLNMFCHDLPQ